MCFFSLSQQEAHRIGDDFLQLEKFVNLNYMVSRERRKGAWLRIDTDASCCCSGSVWLQHWWP